MYSSLAGRYSSCHSSERSLRTPATGYRHYSSGALTSVGEGSWCWSSSSYAAGSVNAGDMGFRSNNVNPLNSDNRANGLSVRCVQHLRRLPF
ncbi:MAG: fibrobacter succinogenes major paralogous domain-containing protein [Alistipes sp.]|nr:fibrobacter succinogenes major paralogous domain-containing protein [Alistipes sp.]